VLPLLASQTFHLDLYTSALTHILAFGLSEAATNYFAGTLSDWYGRKPVLIAGWLVAIPVPNIQRVPVSRFRPSDLGFAPGEHHRPWMIDCQQEAD
jgi:MFS family permease